MKKIAVFPGSFDPFTKGHNSIVLKSLALFDEVVIGIGHNSSKKYLFDIEKRVQHISSIYEDEPKVRIEVYKGLTINFCKSIGAQFIVRGLRDGKDFEYEKSIAQMNLEMSGIESIFFMTDPKYAAISSTIIRDVYIGKGNIEPFVINSDILVNNK